MLTATLAVISCGCASHVITKTTVTQGAAKPVAKDASREESIERYNAVARGIQTLNATVELKPTAGSKYSGVIQEYHEVKAFLLVARPANIRVIGQVPVIGKTAFDMASDGETFRVSIPSKNKFLVGPVSAGRTSDKPIENLRPEHLLDAFLWPEIRKEEEVLFEEYNDDGGRYYVLTVLRGGYRTEILRKIWFDRADLQVSRLEDFAPKGVLMADIHLSDWRSVDTSGTSSPATSPAGASNNAVSEFAHTVVIDRPHDDYKLELQISKIILNEPIPAAKFQLDQPPGSELVRVGEATQSQQQNPAPAKDQKP
jgi:outer membrane lipoprotein-sorting protein